MCCFCKKKGWSYLLWWDVNIVFFVVCICYFRCLLWFFDWVLFVFIINVVGRCFVINSNDVKVVLVRSFFVSV